jgi:membrane dipeptidase
MPAGAIPLAKEIDRVPSSTVPLDHSQEQRFQRLMESLIMVDVHVHPMVLPEDMEQLTAYLRTND